MPAPRGWTFHARAGASGEEPLTALAQAASFDVALDLAASDAGARQIGGRYHGELAADVPLTLRWNASVPMRVEIQAASPGGAATSGTCDWPADSTDEKTVGVARVRMRSTDTTCELVLTPTVALAGEAPTFRWEARTREARPDGWSLRFEATAEG